LVSYSGESSVANGHRFDGDRNPDPNFHVDAYPDPDPDWYQNDANPHADPKHVGKSKTFLTFGFESVKRCVVIFRILNSILKFSRKKVFVYSTFSIV
jgi:hypothetical protein